jgi:hypothetical protein
MQRTTYGIKIAVALPWDAAVARTTEALKAEGFGVLTTIDVQATLRTKLDREFRKYAFSAPATLRWLTVRCRRSWRSVSSCPVTSSFMRVDRPKPLSQRWRRWLHSASWATTPRCTRWRSRPTHGRDGLFMRSRRRQLSPTPEIRIYAVVGSLEGV